MEIIVPVALYKVFKKFPSGHVAKRQFDVILTLTSSGVAIRGLPDGGLSVLMPGCRKRVCRRYIVFSLHPKLRGTSVTRVPVSRSQSAVFL